MQEIILGAPGTGKTTALLLQVEKELAAGIPPDRIGYFTFTRRGAIEAIERACKLFNLQASQLPYFRTIHSMCYRALQLKTGDLLVGKAFFEFADYAGVRVTGRSWSDDGLLTGFEMGDRALFMENLSRVRQVPLRQQYDENPDGMNWNYVARVSRALVDFKMARGLLDYTDMLQQFVAEDRDLGLKKVFVDEFQDTSSLQHSVIEVLARSADRVVVAGDDDQCHPAGTLILTPRGQVPIEKLKDNDTVIQWERNGQHIRRIPHRLRRSRHWHSGELISVNGVECTPDHLWLIRWINKQNGGYVVYIMKRGNHTRVGWCQFFNVQNVLHIEQRRKLDDADSLWILRCFPSKRGASFYEQEVSIRYGIPTIMFKEAHGNFLYTQDAIDSFFQQHHTLARWESCLRDHGRDKRFPFLDKKGLHRRRSTLMLVRACNLIDGLVAVPVPKTNKITRWSTAKVTRRQFRGWVYGLDAPPHHYYVANGTITHNCIYRWAGADVEHMIDMPGDERVLGQSYRCPPIIQKLSNKIIHPVEHRRLKKWKAKRGSTGSIDDATNFAEVTLSDDATTLILARNIYVLREQVEPALRAEGVVYEMAGKSSIDPDMVRAAASWEDLRKGEPVTLGEARRMYKFIATNTGVKRGFKELKTYGEDDDAPVTMTDLLQTGGLRVDPNLIWHDALDRLPTEQMSYMLAARRRGEKLRAGAPRVKLSTIHSAKGGEADHVIVMKEMAKRTFDEMHLNPDDERRVWYVGVTRARERLTLVSSDTKRECPWI